MRNLEKVGWAGWCPRRGRNGERRCTRSRVYASGSCVRRLARGCAHARTWASIRTAHASYPFPVLLSHARVPRLGPRAPTHAQVCRGDVGARTCSREEKYALLRCAPAKTSGFTARINSGSSKFAASLQLSLRWLIKRCLEKEREGESLAGDFLIKLFDHGRLGRRERERGSSGAIKMCIANWAR